MFTIWVGDKAVETTNNRAYARGAAHHYEMFYRCFAFVMPH